MTRNQIVAHVLRICEYLFSGRTGSRCRKLGAYANRFGSAVCAAAAPLIFAAAWTLLYPAWRSLAEAWLPHAVPSQWLALSWPLPSLLEMACGMVPALTFIWIGFLAYIAFRRDILDDLSPLRLIASLSASLNVLLLSTLALLQHCGHEMLSVTRENFYSFWHIYGVSLPLAFAIFLGIWMVLPRTSPPPRAAPALARLGTPELAAEPPAMGSPRTDRLRFERDDRRSCPYLNRISDYGHRPPHKPPESCLRARFASGVLAVGLHPCSRA